MRDLLTKHGIPATNLRDAVEFLTDKFENDEELVVTTFLAEFKLTPQYDDMVSTAGHAVDAILRGAATVGKVVEHVGKRMIGLPVAVDKPVIVPAAPVMVIADPVVDNEDVTVTPVATAPAAVKGRKGRRKLGNSDYCRAVAILDKMLADGAQATREQQKAALVAANMADKSANHYLWRYHKLGLRD
jgi:hypothetical protein